MHDYIKDFFYDIGTAGRIAWIAFLVAALLVLISIWTYPDFDLTAKLVSTAAELLVVSGVFGLKATGD